MNRPAARSAFSTLPARLRAAWLLVLPLLATLLVYHAVGDFEFVNFDDDTYVQANPRVTGGLTGQNIRWAFTTGHEQVWVPATWLSLQLDATLFGSGPRGFHRTNLLLHLVTVGLAWLLARRLTGSAWAATFVAMLVGVHPVNVEAVAWVTARKDVLMAPLLLGSALAWAAAPGRARLPLAAALAIAAMLAKPAAVVAPALLLLVGWQEGLRARAPRRRLGNASTAELVVLAVLLAVAALVAFATMRLAQGGEMGVAAPVPLLQRLGDAAAGVARYLGRLAWPQHLAVRYPEAGLRLAPVLAAIAGIATIGVTAALLRWRRRLPLAAFGWLWFLACLVPSSGLVQGGQLPMGDRYVYVGAIGLWVAAAGASARLAIARPRARLPLLVLAAALSAALAVGAARQVGTWRGPEPLWRHALAVTRDNEVAHQNLAVVLDAAGRRAEALEHLEAAIRIRPRSEQHFNAGNVNAALGRPGPAEAHYRAALRLNPSLAEASLNLGSLLGGQDRLAEAREVLLAAAARRPELAPLQYNLAVVAWRLGEAGEAAARCRRALELDPGHAGARELFGRLAAAPGGS